MRYNIILMSRHKRQLLKLRDPVFMRVYIKTLTFFLARHPESKTP